MAYDAAFHERLKTRSAELTQLCASHTLEPSLRAQYQKELSQVNTSLEVFNTCSRLMGEREATGKERAAQTDPQLQELFDEELQQLDQALVAAQLKIEEILYPPDPRDDRSVFLEIRAGAGGQEAALFVADLVKMYTAYSLERGWQVTVVELSLTDLGGYREAVLHIQGRGVFGNLKFESGVHRVQRVPATETQGRVHTSTVTVTVLPEVEDVEISINPADLRIDCYRAGGAGGQHVNKTESAVRITHIPTGVVVTCQDDRSQHKNKAKAMKALQARLFALQEEKKQQEMSQSRREQMGTGMRAEKVRTYNFPQNRVSDHQVGLTLSKLDRVMQGDLEDIIDALRAYGRELRRAQQQKKVA